MAQSKGYTAEISPRGGLVVKFDGFQIASSIIDRDYFVQEWFTGHELEIIAEFDDATQQILKESEPRIYSGLYPYSHTDRVVENAFITAKEFGVPLDFETVLLLIGHDRIEDHSNIRGLKGQWEQARRKDGYDDITRLGQELVNERIRLRGQIQEETLGYLSNIHGIPDGKRSDLEMRIKASVLLISDLSRDSRVRVYAESMEHQYSRVRDEDLSQTLRRVFVKNEDRKTNLTEHGSLLPNGVMRDIELAFRDRRSIDEYVMGEELQRRFGGIKAPRGMPNSVRVQTSVKSVFPLQYLNEMLNKYGVDIESGVYGERAKQLLILVGSSKQKLIEATLNLVNSAIKSYEPDRDIRRIKPGVDVDVEAKRRGTFYDRATLGGVIEQWMLWDARGRGFIEGMERIPELKQKIYETARHTAELIPRYRASRYEGNRVVHFTLQNFNALVMLLPDYYDITGPNSSKRNPNYMMML